MGKIVLINVQKFLDEQYNEANQAPVLNMVAGKLNETIKVPVITKTKSGDISDPEVVKYEIGTKTIKKASRVEILFPEPALMVGGGIDFIGNKDRKGNALATDNRLIHIKKGSTEVNHFPRQPYMCIVPAQFNVPSIDNYGFTHPADRSNFIKMLAATQSLGSATQQAAGGANSGGLFGSGLLSKVSSSIVSGVVGASSTFFGDKGTLANSSATVPSILSGNGDPIKFFIQGQGTKSKGVFDENGYMDLQTLENDDAYLEINQANGQYGKYGKSMSPSQNNGFDDQTVYRGLGIGTISTANGNKKLPFLATPFSGSFPNLVINQDKINDLMKSGAPRLNVNSGDELKPMVFPET